jgi:hypothetical protein
MVRFVNFGMPCDVQSASRFSIATARESSRAKIATRTCESRVGAHAPEVNQVIINTKNKEATRNCAKAVWGD